MYEFPLPNYYKIKFYHLIPKVKERFKTSSGGKGHDIGHMGLGNIWIYQSWRLYTRHLFPALISVRHFTNTFKPAEVVNEGEPTVKALQRETRVQIVTGAKEMARRTWAVVAYHCRPAKWGCCSTGWKRKLVTTWWSHKTLAKDVRIKR